MNTTFTLRTFAAVAALAGASASFAHITLPPGGRVTWASAAAAPASMAKAARVLEVKVGVRMFMSACPCKG